MGVVFAPKCGITSKISVGLINYIGCKHGRNDSQYH